MKRVALHNLGCKVNSYEMDVMRQFLQESGYEIVDFNQKADIYIINTCTVTNIADRKSRQMIHQAKKRNPGAVVVAVGCYVQTAEDSAKEDPCIDLAIGNNRKKDLVKILEAYLEERDGSGDPSKPLRRSCVIDISRETDYEEMQLTRTGEHTRAYIKIQDGCNQFCSYCAIPLARGRVRSRKPEHVLTEIRNLAQSGYKEVVITGIHLSSYGLDFHGESYNSIYQADATAGQSLRANADELISLLGQIQQIDGITRIRLGSLEPRIITETFAAELAALDKLCPHFHLSLQSGCDTVLQRMNRKYRTADFMKSVEILRKSFDRPAITTDVITGFPGETEEEFAQTADFLRKVQFFEMHIFPYSRRRGTAAASMAGQLTEQQKKDRSAILLQMEKELSLAYRRMYAAAEMEVLFEQAVTLDGETYQVGHTRNYIKAAKKTEKSLCGQEILCRMNGLLDHETLLVQ